MLEKKKRFCFVLFCFLIDAILPGLGNCKVYCGEYWLKKKKKVKWRARIEVDMGYKTNNK